MSRFNFTMDHIVVLLFLQGTDLRFGQDFTGFSDMTLQGGQAFLKRLQIPPQPDRPDAGGREMKMPRLRNSLDTRNCPNAGCSMANAATAASVASSTRFLGLGLRRLASMRVSSPPVSIAD